MEDQFTYTVDIETQKSTTSIAQLRKEVKELKSQLLNLDSGTQEYADTLDQLGSKLGQIKDTNEMARAATQDFGQQVANVTGTLQGVAGGVTVITGALSLMGVEAGEDSKLMKTLVSLMAMTQGIAAVESGIKAFKGLTTAIKASTIVQRGLNAAMKANPIGFILGAVAALVAVVGTLVSKTKQAREEAEKLNRTLQDLHDTMEANWESAVHGDANAVKFLDNAQKRQEQIQREIELLKAKGKAESGALKEQIKLQKVEEQRAKQNADNARKREADDKATLEHKVEEATRARAQYKDGSAEYKAWTKHLDDANARLTHAQEVYSQTYQVEAYWINQVTESEHQLKLARIKEGKTAAEEARKRREKAKADAEAAEKAKTWLDILSDMRAALQKLNPELAKYWEKFADLNKTYASSADISPKIQEALGVGAITQKRAEKFWKAMLDGNEDFLRQYEQQLIKADQKKGTTDPFLLEQEDLERKKKLNAERIRILQNEIAYYEFTKDAEDDYLRQANLALISNIENEQRLLDQQIANSKYNKARVEAENAYLEAKKNLREQEKQSDYDFWDWQYENAWSSFERQNSLRKQELEKEQEYYKELKDLAQENGNTDDLQEASNRLVEIADELNNLDLSKSKQIFKTWGDSITKILGNVTDVMGSLMSYYATVTDEAVADLEDKLNEGLITQEEYDAQSEKLKEEQFERNKQFQLAQALINGAAGIIQIIGDASIPSYWAKIAAIAATTISTGLEIAAIQAQHYHSGKSSGGSGSSGGGSGENWINVAPAYQMNDNTNTNTDQLQQLNNNISNQRVYILESDIQDSNRRVQVREQNTRF